jgi:hypothetical protein
VKLWQGTAPKTTFQSQVLSTAGASYTAISWFLWERRKEGRKSTFPFVPSNLRLFYYAVPAEEFLI